MGLRTWHGKLHHERGLCFTWLASFTLNHPHNREQRSQNLIKTLLKEKIQTIFFIVSIRFNCLAINSPWVRWGPHPGYREVGDNFVQTSPLSEIKQIPIYKQFDSIVEFDLLLSPTTLIVLFGCFRWWEANKGGTWKHFFNIARTFCTTSSPYIQGIA